MRTSELRVTEAGRASSRPCNDAVLQCLLHYCVMRACRGQAPGPSPKCCFRDRKFFSNTGNPAACGADRANARTRDCWTLLQPRCGRLRAGTYLRAPAGHRAPVHAPR